MSCDLGLGLSKLSMPGLGAARDLGLKAVETVNAGGRGWGGSRPSMLGLGDVATANAEAGHGCYGR